MERSSRLRRKILVSVLDWGLGHAARTAVIIGRLVSRGDEVTIAGSGESFSYLCRLFPQLDRLPLRSFSPRLSSGNRQWLAISLQVPSFLWSIVRERWQTSRYVREHGFEVVLSDNRYGVRSRRARSYIVTHQLHPHIAEGCPRWVERFVSYCLCRMIGRFDGCLLPDMRIGGLSGVLSSPVPRRLRVHAVGLLSQMTRRSFATTAERYDWLGIASGAEPQRALFIENLVRLFEKKSAAGARCVVVCGDSSREDTVLANGTRMYAMADAELLGSLIANASNIVCRSGYSTVMDLCAMGKTAFLVPTPGQGEQEYLARHLTEHGFRAVSQKEMQQI